MLLCGFYLGAQMEVPGRPVEGLIQSGTVLHIYELPFLHPMEKEAFNEELRQEEARSKVGLFAVERFLNISPESGGIWTHHGARRIWRAQLRSPGALSLGLIFEHFRLEPGVKLLIYTPSRTFIKGAYSNLNNKASGVFAVGHLPGEEVVVELQVPENLNSYGELELGSLSHALLPVAIKRTTDERFGLSGDCEIDIACPEGQQWQSQKHSVVRIYNSTQHCSGVLINNTASDGDPLLLTAKHCIDREYLARVAIFDYDYESPSCFGGDTPIDWSRSGSELLAVGDSIDFSLVRLLEPPPDFFGVSYAGWDLEDPGKGTTVIHHPEGDVKKISFDYETPVVPDEISSFHELLAHSLWWIKQWDVGSTEGGSSGSPLFNSNKRVVGLLSFGKASCGDSIGYNYETGRAEYSLKYNVDDYFSRLAVAWDHESDSSGSLQHWLDPLSTGQRSLGSYDPLDPNSDLEPEPENDACFLKIWPNPSSGEIFIQAGSLLQAYYSYRIFNWEGRLMGTGEVGLNGGPGRLDVAKLYPGLYLLELWNQEDREVLRFVKTP